MKPTMKHAFGIYLTQCALFVGAQVTWTGGDSTWDQPDTDSFNATYNSGNNVIFGNTGVGAVTVGAGVTPGTVSFQHSSGTYSFSGTAWNAGASALNLTGGGTVQMGNLTNTAFAPTWGATNISGGSQLNYTRGTNIGSSGSTVTLNNGTLRVGADNTGTYSYNNPIHVQSGGGALTGTYTGNVSVFSFTGNISGSGPLSLSQSTTQNIHLLGGLNLSGSNSGFSGPVTISTTNTGGSSLTYNGVRYAGMTRFGNSDALFSGASSVTVRDGGIAGFAFAVTDANLAGFSSASRGGIGAYGSGTFTGLTGNVLSSVGKGGMLYLENYDTNNNNRISDTAAFAMDSTYLFIRGRNATNTQTTETIGDVTLTGGNRITLQRSNSTSSGVKLTLASLAAPTAGNSLWIDYGNQGAWSTGASDAMITVAGAKPAVSNGMVSAGIQLWVGAAINTLGDFMTFSGNDLISASSNYTNFSDNTWADAASTAIVNLTASSTLAGSGNVTIHALRIAASGTHDLGGRTVNLGSGGLITTSATVSNGTLNFGSVPGYIGAYNGASQAHISASIAGSGGITVVGNSQSMSLTGNNSFTNGLFINNGSVGATTSAVNGNNVVVNAFGRFSGVNANATTVIGGLRGEGRVTGFFQGNSSTFNTLELSPAAGSHTFNGIFANGEAGRVLSLTKSGAGTQIFGADAIATHSGANAVNAGTLLVHGNFSGATGGFSVADGAVFGGNGVIGGNLNMAAGALLAFNSGWTLTVNGDVSLDSTFGVASLSGLTGSVALGTYTLIQGTDTDFSTLGIANFGAANAVSIGDGKYAYFSQGSLVLNVIPEPGTLALVGVALAAGVMGLRRRR